MAMNFQGTISYDNVDYFEFMWKYERLVEHRKQENDELSGDDGMTSLANLDPSIHSKMMGQ